MVKNLFLLALLTWVGQSYAKDSVVHDTMADAESYKVQEAAPDQAAQRSLAGSKIKKNKQEVKGDGPEKSEATGPGSEVRYWQYSE